MKIKLRIRVNKLFGKKIYREFEVPDFKIGDALTIYDNKNKNKKNSKVIIIDTEK